MSNKKTLEQMSTTEAKRAGITSLADRPNDKSRYGDGGLSAEMLKARFDALPNLVREKFNKIAEMLAGTDAAKYITLGGEDNALGETLFDFLALFGPRGDGITDKNISDLIETLYQEEGDEGASSRTLKDIVASICARLVALKSFADESLGSIDIYVDGDGGIVYETADRNGLTVNLSRLDPIGKDGIGDGAVSFEKLDAELGERVSRAFAKARYTASDGKLHFDSADGEELDSIDLPLESIIVSGTFDTLTKDLVFTLVGGGTLRIPFDEYIEAVASDVARLDAKTNKSFKTATLAGDDTLVFETHDGTVSTVDLSTVALDGQTRDTIARLEKNDADHERRISNVEEHISDDYFVTDNSVAYEKAVPARACSSAKLLSLGGMTYNPATNNLLPYPYYETTKTVNGITFTDNGDGTITANGTATAQASFRVYYDEGKGFLEKGKSYTISDGTSNPSNDGYYFEFGFTADQMSVKSVRTSQDVRTLTYNESYYSVKQVRFEFIIKSGTTVNDLLIKPMVNEGGTALPWGEELQDSKVTEIKSYGANLLPILPVANQTINGVTFTLDEDGVYHLSGTATSLIHREMPISLPAGTYTLSLNHNKVVGTKSGDNIGINIINATASWRLQGGTHQAVGYYHTRTETQPLTGVLFSIYNGVNCDGVTIAPMLNEGATALPYKLYREPISYPIPAEIQAIEGYGKDGFNIDLSAQTSDYNGDKKPLPVPFDSIIKVEDGGSLEFVNEYKNPVPSEVKYLLKEESAV